ncbi:MAG: hypothetical protein WBC44_14375 [Planctomycetaceae bacterium]
MRTITVAAPNDFQTPPVTEASEPQGKLASASVVTIGSADDAFVELWASGLLLSLKPDGGLGVRPARKIDKRIAAIIRENRAGLIAILRSLPPEPMIEGCTHPRVRWRPKGATHFACVYCSPPDSDDEVDKWINFENGRQSP